MVIPTRQSRDARRRRTFRLLISMLLLLFAGTRVVADEFSQASQYRDNTDLAQLFDLPASPWDSQSEVFEYAEPGERLKQWIYSSKLQLRLSDVHQLGFEAMLPATNPEFAMLTFGYSGYFSESFTLGLSVGAFSASPEHLSVQAELTWSVF